MPSHSEGAVRVRGLRELQRAFKQADKTLTRELRKALREAAEPIRADAQRLAASEITNINEGDRWAGMRVGVTQSLVYVAPKERGRRSRSNPSIRRPNLAALLMDDAMQPALDANEEIVVREVEHVLDTVGAAWERV